MTAQPPSEGTFDFCAKCPAHSHCCRRIRTHGEMETPFLLEREARKIESVTGVSFDKFVDAAADELRGTHFSIKSLDGACLFFNKNGLCSIYKDRPLDCQLFPFDMIESSSGELYWIVYEDLCPAAFDYSKYFSNAKKLASISGYSFEDFRSFASHGAALMRNHKHKIIEPVATSIVGIN